MIVVRDIFQLHFGKAQEALGLLSEGREALKKQGYPVTRLLTDLTGEYYTLVMESSYDSLSALEAALGSATEDDEWRQIYARFVPLVREGRREIFRVVD